MSVEFRWDKNALKNVLGDALKTIRDRARRSVSGVVCPEHGQRVRFIAGTGAIGRIEACCAYAQRLGQEALARALKG